MNIYDEHDEIQGYVGKAVPPCHRINFFAKSPKDICQFKKPLLDACFFVLN